MRFSIVRNDYEQSQELEASIKANSKQNGWIYDEQNPEIVFVIGGDGTVLDAVQKYNKQLDEIKFYPIMSGGIGFYTNHIKAADALGDIFDIKLCNPEQFDLLEINIDDNIFYALNEVKVVSEIRPQHLNVYVDDELLEQFSGTGFVFSTSSGSTGYMKSNHGAIIYPQGLFEMDEIAPVSTVLTQTIDAPIIFNNQTITLEKELEKEQGIIVIDSRIELNKFNKISIKLSDKKVNVIRNKQVSSKTKLLNDIFVTNKKINK